MTRPLRFLPGNRRLRPVAMALLAFLVPALARAQSLNGGAISGLVHDAGGQLLPEATVTLTEQITGARLTRATPRDGRFGFTLLLPSNYDLLVERFGFQPRLIRNVPVRAGSLLHLDILLREGAGVDSSTYLGAPPGGAFLALSGGRLEDDATSLASRADIMSEVAGLLPGAGEDVTSEGLPGRFGAFAIDGMVRWAPHHPRLSSGALDGILFPLAAVHGIEMLPAIDAEWPGAGGGLFSGFNVAGARQLRALLSVAGGPTDQRGSLIVSGPAVRDTAHFAFGIAAAHLNPNLGAPWGADSIANGAVATAQDSFQVNLAPYQADWKPTTTIISGFGRFDWLIAAGHRVSVRADAATATLDDPLLGSAAGPSLGSTLKTRDVSAAAMLTSSFGSRVGSEFRFSFDAGNRDYSGAGLAGTQFVEGGLDAGTSDIQPGLFKRSSIRIAETAHYRLSFGILKAGIGFGFNTFDQTFTEGRDGVFAFGDSLGFAARRGSFRQAVGSTPFASFKTSSVYGFLQGLVRPTATLEVQLGVRYEQERFPFDQIRLNTDWLSTTGIDNRIVPGRRVLASPNVGFTWTPDTQRRWQVVGEAGRSVDPADPGQIAEALTHDAGVPIRRAFGTLGAWPAVPDSTIAPVVGKSITLLGPQYAPPQSGRARFGITGNMGGTVVRLQAAYRHTDYLPVRRDLNLPASPRGRDQDGRVVYGTLTKAGALVGPVPGSNRRFAAFDDVSTLDPAAASDYYGFSAGLERMVSRGFGLMLTYTFSRTTDNWFGARDGSRDAQFLPPGDTISARSRSDFDVPHRIVLGAQFRLPGSGVRVIALYRRRSGYPFTPGYRDGVDVNGDGSGRNDAAFVSDTLPGADVVVRGNSCLRSQTGRFAERNSCREPSVAQLDLRLAVPLSRLRAGTELTLDVLGLAATGLDVTDHALFLVDPAAALTTSAAGVTTIPMIANPNFGKPLVKRDPGVAFRAGLRVML